MVVAPRYRLSGEFYSRAQHNIRYDLIKAQILVMIQKQFYSMTQWPSSSVNARRLESKGLFMAKPQWPHDQLK